MAEDVRKWLRDIGCEHYHPIFVQNGYNNLGALRSGPLFLCVSNGVSFLLAFGI